MNFWRSELFYHAASAGSRPLVASSACLLGEAVRYDGTHKQHDPIQRWLAPHLQLQAICPEVGIGLAVPRPALKLVEHKRRLRVIGEQDDAKDCAGDVTEPLVRYADQHVQQIGQFWPLCAFIFKARSPSCGVGSTLVNPGTDREYLGHGAFAGRLATAAPWLPLYEEEDLQGEEDCANLLLLSYLGRDILWSPRTTDVTALQAHYQAILDRPSIGLDTADRHALWQGVRAALSGAGNEKRRELIDQYRAA